MFFNRVFQITFLASLITHGIILSQNTNLRLFSKEKKEQKLEISYVKPPKKNKADLRAEIPAKEEPFLKLPLKVAIQQKIPPPFMDKENIFKDNKPAASQLPVFIKPTFIKPDIIAVKKKITVPALNIDKINNPSYISYYQIVREKIRRAAYQNYARIETGQVYLSFIISNDGYLKEIRLSEEKSSSSSYLREIALRSIKEASPFPNFPKELDYPQLSFNVVISFEIE